MSFDEGISETKVDSKCSECMLFYASKAFDGLCSSCYKSSQHIKKEKIEAPPSNCSTPLSIAEKEVESAMEQLSLEPTKREQKDRKRCFDCNKKVGLLGIECKCGFVYCNSHRLPEYHACDFDHRQHGKEKLKTQIVKIQKGKVAYI